MSGYRLHVLDLRGWAPFIGKARPGPVSTIHATREEAERARRALPQHEDVVTTITPIAPAEPRARRTKVADPTQPDAFGGCMRSRDRKLTL